MRIVTPKLFFTKLLWTGLIALLFNATSLLGQINSACQVPPYISNLINEVKLRTCLDPNSSGFGESMSYFGNKIAIGDPSYDGKGAVYIFQLNATSGNWKLQDMLIGSDTDDGDAFGYSVSLQGQKLVAGAPGVDDMGSNTGAAYVFEKSGGIWTETARLRHDSPSTGDGFGTAVAMLNKWVVISAPFDDIAAPNGVDAGSVHTFKRIGTAYVPKEVKVLPYLNHIGEFFGEYLELTEDWLMVGSTQSGQNLKGRVHVYQFTGTRFAYVQNIGGTKWDRLGASVQVSGDWMAFGTNWYWDGAVGEVHVYKYNPIATLWEPFQIIYGPESLRPEEAGYNDRFGTAVAIEGNRLIVNSKRQRDGLFEVGGIYWYEFDGISFEFKTKYIVDDYTNDYFRFGKRLALQGDKLVAFGRYGANTPFNRSAVYVVDLDEICMPPNTGMTYTVLPGGDVQFDWDAAPDAIEYTLKLRSRFDNSYSALYETTGTSYTISAVPATTDFIWDVRSTCSDGEKSYRYEGPDFGTAVLRNATILDNFSVYPNPVKNGQLNVKLPVNGDLSLGLYTLTGSLAKDFSTELSAASSEFSAANSSTHSIEIGDLPAGIYVLKLEQGENNWYEKVVVQ